MSIEDNRKTVKHIVPYLAWIPEGVTNYLFDITDKDDVKVGEIEIGSDNFLQLRIEIGKKCISFNGNVADLKKYKRV